MAYLLLVVLAVHGLKSVRAEHSVAAREGRVAAISPAPPRWLAWFSTARPSDRRPADPGHSIDLGRPVATPAQAWVSALFGAPDVTIPSCLTQPAPAASIGDHDAVLPVRDDLPGFYGAPWTAHVNGDLIALLHVYAPRDSNLPVDAPTLQIYRHYDGHQTAPSFAAAAPARVYRGAAGVLYRAWPGGPVKCLDLVVPKDRSFGTAYLYYRGDSRYFERTARFAIQN